MPKAEEVAYCKKYPKSYGGKSEKSSESKCRSKWGRELLKITSLTSMDQTHSIRASNKSESLHKHCKCRNIIREYVSHWMWCFWAFWKKGFPSCCLYWTQQKPLRNVHQVQALGYVQLPQRTAPEQCASSLPSSYPCGCLMKELQEHAWQEG